MTMKSGQFVQLSNAKFCNSGSYGRVFIGEYQGKKYAVKRRYITDHDRIPPGCVHVNEIDIMSRLKHPNLSRAVFIQRQNPIPDGFRQDSYNPSGENVGVSFRADLIYIISDAADGDLDHVCISETGKIITEQQKDELRSIMWQILSGIAYLHSQNIIHRDIKPANILFTNEDNQKQIRICDFDMCLPYIPTYESFKAMTPEYTPPEVLTQGADVMYTPKVDIWSAGHVLYHLVTGYAMIKRGRRRDLELDNYITAIAHAFLPGGDCIEFPPPCDISDVKIDLDLGDEQVNDLLNKMLQCDPSKRLTAVECMQHPFFLDRQIPTFPVISDHIIEKHFITEEMASVFDPYMSPEITDPKHYLSDNQYYGFFLGLDILMRVCTKKYKGNGRNLAICCFNIGMKFFDKETACFIPIDSDDAKRIEYSILADKLGGRIYRDTIYNNVPYQHQKIYRYLMAPEIFPCKFSEILTAIKKHVDYT